MWLTVIICLQLMEFRLASGFFLLARKIANITWKVKKIEQNIFFCLFKNFFFCSSNSCAYILNEKVNIFYFLIFFTFQVICNRLSMKKTFASQSGILLAASGLFFSIMNLRNANLEHKIYHENLNILKNKIFVLTECIII